MTTEIFVIVLVTQGLLFGAFCAYVAGQKNRGTGDWALLGFFFGIIALLAVVGIPPLEKNNSASVKDDRPKIKVETTPELKPAYISEDGLSWYCACGQENPLNLAKKIQNCVKCRFNRDYVLNKYKA